MYIVFKIYTATNRKKFLFNSKKKKILMYFIKFKKKKIK